MRRFPFTILMLLLVMSLVSCDRTPGGVLSINEMADLIVDLQLADAYIENNIYDFTTDSSKLVVKQSVFKKHGITQEDYDSSLVWYAHNMDDYIKAHDKAIGKLQEKLNKANHGVDNEMSQPGELIVDGASQEHGPKGAIPKMQAGKHPAALKKLGADAKSDTADLWNAPRSYMLAQGAKRGFITFEVQPGQHKRPGDRYQLVYKLARGNSSFTVSLNVDYTDGATSQMTRGTNSDGWVTVDIQSDSTRQVKRVYGYVSYDMKRGQTAYVDSLMLLRTHLDKKNYGYIHVQRLLERGKKQ